MLKKPTNIIYGIDDTPPLAVTALNGMQTLDHRDFHAELWGPMTRAS